MREIVELRLYEKYARLLFRDDEGKRLGDSVRKIMIDTTDPRYAEIDRLQRKLGGSVFAGWYFHRRYTRAELAEARCFQFVGGGAFEAAGEMGGEPYDESTACPKCGAGAVQIADLRLDLRKAPKHKDLAHTLAGEHIVSQRLAERMIDAGLTGFEFRRVRHKARYEDDPVDLSKLSIGREILRRAEAAGAPHGTGRFDVWMNRADNRPLWEQAIGENAAMKRERARLIGKPAPVWHQLVVTSNHAEIVSPTRTGIAPFDEDPRGQSRCPLGDTIGLVLLSEVSISAASRGDADIVCSRQFVGMRQGVLRPRRIMLVSARFHDFMLAETIKEAWFEVAHLV